MALPQQYLPALSTEQYLDLERLSEMRHEFLDGLMYAMAGETPDHSTICFNLAYTVGSQIKDEPCRGFSPNMKVRTGLGDLYAYPDLMIVCGEPRFHDKRGDVLLNPTVIFEVLSPSTEKYDRVKSFGVIARRSTVFRTMCSYHRIRSVLRFTIANRTARGVR